MVSDVPVFTFLEGVMCMCVCVWGGGGGGIIALLTCGNINFKEFQSAKYCSYILWEIATERTHGIYTYKILFYTKWQKKKKQNKNLNKKTTPIYTS